MKKKVFLGLGVMLLFVAGVTVFADEPEQGGRSEIDCWNAIKVATAQSTVYCGTCKSTVNSEPTVLASLKKCKPGGGGGLQPYLDPGQLVNDPPVNH